MGGSSVEDRKDATVQVSLASSLGVTGYGQDGGARPVPGDKVGRPAKEKKTIKYTAGQHIKKIRNIVKL